MIFNIARLIEETLQFCCSQWEDVFVSSPPMTGAWLCKNPPPLAPVRLVSEPQDFLWPSLDLGEGFVPLNHQILVKSKYLAIQRYRSLFKELWPGLYKSKLYCRPRLYFFIFCVCTECHVSSWHSVTHHTRGDSLAWILTSNNGSHCRVKSEGWSGDSGVNAQSSPLFFYSCAAALSCSQLQ